MLPLSAITDHSIKDDAFDVNLIAEYSLFIRIHRQAIGVCVFHMAEKRCLLLEHFTFEPTATTGQLIDYLADIWTQHSFLNAAFWKQVVVSFAHLQFTTAPSDLVFPENQAELLRFNTSLKPTERVATNEHAGFQLTSLFAVPEKLEQWFREVYPNTILSLVHPTAAFLRGITSLQRVADTDTLFLHIYADQLMVCYLRKERLYYINTFEASSAKDFLYYILLVMEELGVRQEKSRLVVWGNVRPNDERLVLVKNYVSSLSLGKRPMHLKFTSPFDTHPTHYDFDLLSIHDLVQ